MTKRESDRIEKKKFYYKNAASCSDDKFHSAIEPRKKINKKGYRLTTSLEWNLEAVFPNLDIILAVFSKTRYLFFRPKWIKRKKTREDSLEEFAA